MQGLRKAEAEGLVPGIPRAGVWPGPGIAHGPKLHRHEPPSAGGVLDAPVHIFCAVFSSSLVPSPNKLSTFVWFSSLHLQPSVPSTWSFLELISHPGHEPRLTSACPSLGMLAGYEPSFFVVVVAILFIFNYS